MASDTPKIKDYLDEPRKKRILNEKFFDIIAAEYDRVTPWLSLGGDARWKRKLAAALPETRAPLCIDLACGTGDITRLIADKYTDARIIGLDIVPGMLALAGRRIPEARVILCCADMQHTPLPDAGADIVTGGYALRNAPHLESTLA
jgi:ubiquinone/menaquinone biosynthesis C-methylase UbiE